jgi:NAD+ synthase
MFDARRILAIDVESECDRIIERLRECLRDDLRRRGAVVGISGGIDSSVVLALCAQAFGADRVLGLILPERDSEAESKDLAEQIAARYGVATVTEDITPALVALKCYERRDEAIRSLYPSYDPGAGYSAKIVLPPDLLESRTLNVFYLTLVRPDGTETSLRLPLQQYLQIVAASNFKQRVRMCLLYYHAEKRHYAVVGTANKDEHELGFFVKHGDGGADIKPIAHLFKTQVFALADYLDIPEEVRRRQPTTDTYAAQQTQEEFFFRLPFDTLDTIWGAHEAGVLPAEVADYLLLDEEQVIAVVADLAQKQRTSHYLRLPPVMCGN